MLVNSSVRASWSDLSNFGLNKYGSKWPACSAYYFEVGKQWSVNPVLLALWGAVRSNGFTSKEYSQNIDIYALGGRYTSFVDSIKTGAQELAKFETTAMLQEQVAVEKLYAEFENYFSGLAPVVEPPPVPTPVPVPKPDDTPVDKSASDVDKSPTNWKKDLKWIGSFAGALLVVWSIVSLALPGWASTLGKVVLQLLSSFFGS